MARAALHMEPIWKDLANEILEQHVLPLLPLASLCRLRAVSKKWNTYIAHPSFATLHAIASPAEDFALINLSTNLPFNSLGGWEIVDVAKDSFFKLSQGFMAAQGRPDNIDGIKRIVLAANGGLLLIWYSMAESSPNHMLLVCNLLLKAVKVIPSLPGWAHDHHYDCAVMSTNKASMAYEIVVFHPMVNHYQVKCINIFESTTSRWKRIVNSTMPSPERCLTKVWLIKFKSGLYRLYIRSSDSKPELVKFDKTSGVGSLVPLKKPFFSRMFDHQFLLVVSQDRLFCLSMWGFRQQYSVEIYEIFPERHDCQLVANMPSKTLIRLRGDDKHIDVNNRAVMYYYWDPIVATGCASSILFCSRIGRLVGYDLVSSSWHHYSNSDLLEQHRGSHGMNRYLECMNLSLSLCQP